MKKLLIFLTFITSLQAQLNVGFSLSTKHIDIGKHAEDYDFVEDNDVLTLELQNKKELIGISKFKNSFGNDSLAVYYGMIRDKNNKGAYFINRVGFCKGYNRVDYIESKTIKDRYWEFTNLTVFYEDYSFIVTPGFGYNFNKECGIEANLIGNAVVISIKTMYN